MINFRIIIVIWSKTNLRWWILIRILLLKVLKEQFSNKLDLDLYDYPTVVQSTNKGLNQLENSISFLQSTIYDNDPSIAFTLLYTPEFMNQLEDVLYNYDFHLNTEDSSTSINENMNIQSIYSLLKYSFYYMKSDTYVQYLSKYINILNVLYIPTTTPDLSNMRKYMITLSLYTFMLTPYVDNCIFWMNRWLSIGYMILDYSYLNQLLCSKNEQYMKVAIELFKHLLYICHFCMRVSIFFLFCSLYQIAIALISCSKAVVGNGSEFWTQRSLFGYHLLPTVLFITLSTNDLKEHWNPWQLEGNNSFGAVLLFDGWYLCSYECLLFFLEERSDDLLLSVFCSFVICLL